MATHTFHQPDEEKMRQALKRYAFDPVGIILHLAWLEGLTRKEIYDLTWDRVDFSDRLLRLPDREIPLEEEVAEVLLQWSKRCRKFSEYVAVSERTRRRMLIQSFSILARNALDAFGQTEVTLKDLRYDFIRRQLETKDWPYVLRISGLSVENYRESFFHFTEEKPELKQSQTSYEENEYRIWRMMQSAENTPVKITLWLVQQMGLQVKQIVCLTWDDVDFAANTLRLTDGRVPMTRGVRRTLEVELGTRDASDDPHIILSPKARKPIDAQRLSVMLRTALIRGGIEDLSILDIRCGAANRVDDTLLINYVAEHGRITTKEAAELLSMTIARARSRLKRLTERGQLVCVGTKYYAAETTANPEKHTALILELIDTRGSIRCQDAAELLSISPRQAGRVLKRMVDAGLIVRDEGTVRYRNAEGE